jgi:hypothetical protein
MDVFKTIVFGNETKCKDEHLKLLTGLKVKKTIIPFILSYKSFWLF